MLNAESASNPPLPERSPFGYRQPELSLSSDYRRSEELATAIGEHYSDVPSAVKGKLPLIPEEQLALESLLVFIDSCVPLEGKERRNVKSQPARIARSRALDILNSECASLYDLNDLQQEARLATIAAMRSFQPGVSISLFAVIALRISSHFQHLYRGAIMGGLGSSGKPRRSQSDGPSLAETINDAACHGKEHGWADEVAAVESHSHFRKKTALAKQAGRLANPGSEDEFELCESGARLDRLFDKAESLGIGLTGRQKQLLCLHFELGFSFEDIAQNLNPPVSRQSVSQTIAAALQKLATIKEQLDKALGY